MVEILLEAGLPPLAISCLTGAGGKIGNAICSDRRVRKISFTGSRDVGEQICKTAGLKRVTMELGGHAPVIVFDDADIESAATIMVAAKYRNDKDALTKLTQKVKSGGGGVWGPVPMPPNAQVPDEDIKQLVSWILTLK